MPRRFSYDGDQNFYERLTKPLNLGDDGEIFVIDETDDDTTQPWTKPAQPHLIPGKSQGPSRGQRG
jgi:hypothetical protein